MELIKITEEHYIVVDDSEIKESDYYFSKISDNIFRRIKDGHWIENYDKKMYQKITHSTQPLELLSENGLSGMGFSKVRPLNLFEVKELIGEVDVEKKAEELAILFHNWYEKLAPAFGYVTRIDTKVFDKNSANGKLMIAVCNEIHQAIEDNKEKKYTEEDMWKAFEYGKTLNGYDWFGDLLESLQPKTEWEIEFIDGKLKLK